jgi:hypothetical protein
MGSELCAPDIRFLNHRVASVADPDITVNARPFLFTPNTVPTGAVVEEEGA